MPAASIRVRELRPGDRSRWDELWAGYLRFYEEELPTHITELLWKRLMDPAEQPYAFVAVDGEKIVGFVHYHFHLSPWSVKGYCYLEDLFVDPAIRGKGAGRALIEAVYRASDARGADRVYWLTQASNAPARTLYDKVATLSPFVQYRRGA